MPFNLDYPIDNGQLCGWATATLPGCVLVSWPDEADFSVLAPDGRPLGWGETPADAFSSARLILTERRRQADGVIPARVC